MNNSPVPLDTSSGIYDLRGQTALVTGGAQGLGLEIATEQELIERVRNSIPLGRWGEPADIARAVAFLCSSQAAWMTGEVLRVSGGLEGVSAPLPRAASESKERSRINRGEDALAHGGVQ